MDETVGYINIDGISNIDHYLEIIDKALKKWMKEAEERTIELVDQYWGQIEELSDLLIRDEVVYEETLNAILKGIKLSRIT